MNTPKKKRIFSNIIVSFLCLIFLIMLISLIGNSMGWQATFTRVNSVTGALETNIVTVSNLFSGDEIRNILGNAITNFISFAPLGFLLIAAIAIGVAYKSGFLPIAFTTMGRRLSKFWITFMFVSLGIITSFAGDFGYVMLIPLAGIFYLVNNRNPLAGILATFVAVSAGQGISFLLSSLDYGLAPYTELAAQLTDKSFKMGAYSNIFFTIVGTISLAFMITYITEKIIIPRIPKYKRDEEIIEELVIGRKEKRGLVVSVLGSLIVFITFIYMLIPGLPGSGLLLDNTGKVYSAMLYGSGSYFSQSIVYLLSIVLLVAGSLYGFAAKTIKVKEQFSRVLYDSLNNMSSFIVLIFFASQLIAIFKRSNLGTVITAWLVELVQTLNFTSIPLILLVFVFLVIANLFLQASVTKWTIVSPIVIPLFMNANMTPEFAQAVFRVSEGAANIMTPLSVYFIIFVGFLEMYNKGETRISLGDCYKMLWPYSVAIALLWMFILITWYIIGLPIGFGVYPTV
ncbi:MAG: AbgT family transporter [Bacilli bacterium]|nr:AbgT family transporter [Bacilli bacterium]MDD3305343.1 AbgT family transporter [Bacilli bacterium]MDD4053244.1 AbgT family transporter [Bacilli bacterium]MDD4411232.1 AbgT family transporter [Bacilli bacterium]